MLAPPLTIDERDVDEIVNRLGDAVTDPPLTPRATPSRALAQQAPPLIAAGGPAWITEEVLVEQVVDLLDRQRLGIGDIPREPPVVDVVRSASRARGMRAS